MNLVTRLQELLNAARVSDDEIRGGIKLSEQGLSKLAARLGVTSHDVSALIGELTSKLADEHNADVTAVYESAGGQSYAYECDFVGNLTIRDTDTGEEHYISGSDSAHTIKALRAAKPGSEAEQALLRRMVAQGGAETLEEDDEAVGGDFKAELKNDAGSYNFPWHIGNHHGTATAAYRANDREFKLSVVSIRDDRGEEVEASDQLKAAVTKLGRDFIGQE